MCVDDDLCVRHDLVDTSFPGLMDVTKQLIVAADNTVRALHIDDNSHTLAAELLILAGMSLLMVADKGGNSIIEYNNLKMDGEKLPAQTAHITLNIPAKRPPVSPVTSILKQRKTPIVTDVNNNPPLPVELPPQEAPVQIAQETFVDTNKNTDNVDLTEYDEAVMEWERDQRRFADKPKVTDMGIKTGGRPHSIMAVPARASETLHG